MFIGVENGEDDKQTPQVYSKSEELQEIQNKNILKQVLLSSSVCCVGLLKTLLHRILNNI